MRKQSAQNKSVFSRRLVTVFMAVLLSGESTHYNPTHDPHGNRRERIEEMRRRKIEAQTSSQAKRSMNSGGGDPPPAARVPFAR